MFSKCDELREANRHVVESRERVAAQEVRAKALVGSGHPAEDAASLLEEFRMTLRHMERHREMLLRNQSRGS
jgi:hypothetical protein